MWKMRSSLCVVILILIVQIANAQQLQVSLMSGVEKTDFQTFVVEPISRTGKITFSSLAFFQRYHAVEEQPFDELGVQGALFWNFNRNFALGPGLYYNDPKGLMPKALLQTFHKAGPLSLITNPAFYYHEDGYMGGELFGQLTFMEDISKGWAIFAQLNVLSTWDRFTDHGRSFLQLRAGPRLPSGFQLGFAWDKDWYTARKLSQSSVGFFIERWF